MIFVDQSISVARARLVTLVDGAKVIDAARLLRNAGTDIVVICDKDGVLVGVVTKTNIVEQISRCEGSACTTGISSIMVRDVVVCRPQDRMDDVWSRLKTHGLKNVPVMDECSRPVGVLNARDALQALMQEVEHEESLLRDYVMTVGYH